MSAAAEEGATVAKGSDVSPRPEVATVTEPPVVEKRGRGRPKKKPVVLGPPKNPSETKAKVKVKVPTENPSSSDQAVSVGDGGPTTGCPDEATPCASERPEEGPAGQTRTGESMVESVPLENPPTRLNDDAAAMGTVLPASATIPPASSEASPETPAVAADVVQSSKTPSPLTKDATLTDDVEATTHDVHPTTHDTTPETKVLPPSGGKAEQESVDDPSTCGADDPLPVCPSDKTPSGETAAAAVDGVDADCREKEDDVIVSGDVKDDVKKESSPVRDDVTETSLTAPSTNEPRFAFIIHYF